MEKKKGSVRRVFCRFFCYFSPASIHLVGRFMECVRLFRFFIFIVYANQLFVGAYVVQVLYGEAYLVEVFSAVCVCLDSINTTDL
jgi:hypothetical protein